jgi:putative tryptophan/tyrosine transport system substrate-binding protein
MRDSMRRRDFITILGGAAATHVIIPGLVRAGTSTKRPIIGIPIFLGPSKIGQSFGNLFRQGLQDLGYVLGRDLDIQARNAGGDWDRLPAIVEEIVQLKPMSSMRLPPWTRLLRERRPRRSRLSARLSPTPFALA